MKLLYKNPKIANMRIYDISQHITFPSVKIAKIMGIPLHHHGATTSTQLETIFLHVMDNDHRRFIHQGSNNIDLVSKLDQLDLCPYTLNQALRCFASLTHMNSHRYIRAHCFYHILYNTECDKNIPVFEDTLLRSSDIQYNKRYHNVGIFYSRVHNIKGGNMYIQRENLVNVLMMQEKYMCIFDNDANWSILNISNVDKDIYGYHQTIIMHSI